MRLTADLYPVAVWIDYNALIVAIAGTSRTIDNRDSIVSQTLGELIDQPLRAYRDREVGQPEALNSGRQSHQRQHCRRHQLEACAVGETKKARLESLGGIQVSWTRRRAKVRRVKVLAPSEISGPNRDVLYPHRFITPLRRDKMREKAKLTPNTFAGCPPCFGPLFAAFQARPKSAGEYHSPPNKKLDSAASKTAQMFMHPPALSGA